MKADALINKLSEIHPKGFDLSLDRILHLLEKLGNPQDKLPPVMHVAGTNGKGSTLAFARAILEAQGYKVHVHTSPHLVNWHERYRLAGKLVSDDQLAIAIEHVAEVNENRPITVFELLCAVMFVLFSEHEADFSLVEVGLGGRFDATNVIASPRVCAIAPVGLDHQAYLGDTVTKIAFEKAGIIKPRVPVAIGLQEDDARETIEQVARKKAAPTFFARQDFDFYEDATGFVYQDEQGLLDLPMPTLVGDHQLANAALAIAAIRAGGIKVLPQAFAQGMKDVNWPGRLEKLREGKITQKFGSDADIWIDGGHNPSAGEAIAAELLRRNGQTKRKIILICGMINTKEPLGYFHPFAKLDAEIITVPVAMSEAGIAPQALSAIARDAGLRASASPSLSDGIEYAISQSTGEAHAMVLFCGSLYMVGEVLAMNETPPQ